MNSKKKNKKTNYVRSFQEIDKKQQITQHIHGHQAETGSEKVPTYI